MCLSSKYEEVYTWLDDVAELIKMLECSPANELHPMASLSGAILWALFLQEVNQQQASLVNGVLKEFDAQHGDVFATGMQTNAQHVHYWATVSAMIEEAINEEEGGKSL